MNNFGRSMNESKFHLVLLKPSTHLFQWSEIRLGLLLRRSVEYKFCQTYESHLSLKFLLNLVKRCERTTARLTALQDLQSGNSSFSLLVRGKYSVTQ